MLHNNDHYKIIAQIDKRNYIATCEHNIIHLTWGMVTFRFRLNDFVHMARVLSKAAIGKRGQVITTGAIRLKQDMDGKFTLKIIDIELHMNSIDFLLLFEMVNTSLDSLGIVIKSPTATNRFPPQPGPQYGYDRASFLLN